MSHQTMEYLSQIYHHKLEALNFVEQDGVKIGQLHPKSVRKE